MAEKTFRDEMELYNKDILYLKDTNTSLRRLTLEIQEEKDKLKCKKQALVKKVEHLEIELLELKKKFKKRSKGFDDVYIEATTELKVAKDELEKKSRSLERLKLRVQKKDGDLAKVQDKLREVRIASRKSRKVLKKLRESLSKREEDTRELKRGNELKSNGKKKCKKLKEQAVKLEADLVRGMEYKEKLKDCFPKWINRNLKKQMRKIKRYRKSQKLSKGGEGFVKSKSGEQPCSSSTLGKVGGEPLQVDQGPRVDEKNALYTTRSSSSSSDSEGEGTDGMEDISSKEDD